MPSHHPNHHHPVGTRSDGPTAEEEQQAVALLESVFGADFERLLEAIAVAITAKCGPVFDQVALIDDQVLRFVKRAGEDHVSVAVPMGQVDDLLQLVRRDGDRISALLPDAPRIRGHN